MSDTQRQVSVDACINCRQPFPQGAQRCYYQALSIQVGPFCMLCQLVIEAALQAAREARTP